VLPIAAGAPPSRPVDDAAFELIASVICDAVAKRGFDGIMLDLHGAMVTESFEDGEGELLRRIRAIDADTPIAVAYDMHANLYDAMIDNATVVAGYRTYPHIDTYDTAHRAGEILLMAMRGRVNPVMAWGNVPMLPHVMRQGSDDHPNHELQARCAAMATEGALAASLFTGFPHADIRNAGLSAVVVTDGDRARGLCLPAGAARAIAGAGQGARLIGSWGSAARRGADRALGPLRQLRLGRDDGHDRGACRDPQGGARQCGGLRDL
jgi:microcystin degradation protein MlrC